VRAQLVEERAQAEVFERERKAWEPFYQRAIEYPASLIFVALKSGQLRARGRLLPGKSAEEAGEILQADDKNVYDFPVTDIPDAFWSLNGIDFQASAAGNGSAYYCHVSCNTPDVLSLFPCERKQVSGIEQVGDCFVLDESVRKLPVNSRRGRPPYPWEVFHVEIADLIRRGGLPAKKEAAIQFFQTWFQSQFGISVSRAAIGEKLKPYYERFSRRGGEKIAG
jgi:hypothetical protein